MKKIIQEYNIPCIVGDMFKESNGGKVSPISKKLFVSEDDESRTLRGLLSTFGPVFATSEEAMIHIRKNQ